MEAVLDQAGLERLGQSLYGVDSDNLCLQAVGEGCGQLDLHLDV